MCFNVDLRGKYVGRLPGWQVLGVAPYAYLLVTYEFTIFFVWQGLCEGNTKEPIDGVEV